MDKRQLMAMAGWAMSKRAENAAFDRLCEAIREVVDLVPDAEEIPALPILCEEQVVSRETDVYVEAYRSAVASFQPDVLPLEEGPPPGYKHVPPRLMEKCKHKFDLKTQRCMHCGLSYLDVKSRKPECF